MTKDKLLSLESYRASIRAKLHAPPPAKHTHRQEAYKAFLSKELKAVDFKLEAYRLSAKDGVEAK